MRRKTKSFFIRDLGIGSDFPIFVQSMTNTDTHDVKSTMNQIKALADMGAKLVRVAILDHDALAALKIIVSQSEVPIVADIHFDYRLALGAIEAGADGIRINPGNIGGFDKFKIILDRAKKRKIPIRIGVNSGSIDKKTLEIYRGRICSEAMVESLSNYVDFCEAHDYDLLVLSVKASNVKMMIEANRLAAEKLSYPIHLGVTEAGSYRSGSIKSAVGIGALLVDGIGDTVRISLSGDPCQEIPVAYEILKSSGVIDKGVNIIACPTCGRTQIELVSILEQVENICMKVERPINVAVMGCAVNGPGEAKEADIGIAGGKGRGLIFRKGEIVANVEEKDLLETFRIELDKLLLEDI